MSDVERRVTRTVVIVLAFTGVAAGAMAFHQMLNEVKRVAAVSSLPTFGEVPPFVLTRQDGRAMSRADLLGKVWIADFIFTRCAGPCPMMTRRMENLNSEFRHNEEVRLVTFTVDPEYDTREVLSRYAAQFGARLHRWAFLTGDRDGIYNLCLKGFRLAVDDAAGQDYDHMIIHSTYFVLVDRAARIRGYYDGTDRERLAALVTDVRELLREAAR